MLLFVPRKTYRHPALRDSMPRGRGWRRLRRLAAFAYKSTHFISIPPPETEKSEEKLGNLGNNA